MKFLLDSCISSLAVKDLRGSDFDVIWIPEIGKDPGDKSILKKAFDENWFSSHLVGRKGSGIRGLKGSSACFAMILFISLKHPLCICYIFLNLLNPSRGS